MIKYFVIFIYLLILFIYFSFFKQKDNFKNSNENIKDIKKINKYIIIGKGNEIHKYINVFKQLKQKNKYKFIAFHESFFFFKEKLDFYPDYYTCRQDTMRYILCYILSNRLLNILSILLFHA